MKNCIVVLIVALVVVGFVACGDTTSNDPDNNLNDSSGELIKVPGPDGAVATVGQVNIPIKDYYELLNSTRIAMIEKEIDIDAPENADMKLSIQDEIIENLVDMAVYENYAIEKNLMPTMTVIEDSVSKEVEKQALKAGSYDLLEEMLKDEGGIKELRKLLRSDPKFKDKLIRENVIEFLKSQVEITEENAKEFYESRLLGLAQIVIIYDSENHTKEEIQKAKEYTAVIRKRIGDDITFNEAAREFSMDVSTAQDGGRLSELTANGTLSPELDKIAFSLSIGEVSEVVESENAFVILKLEYEKYVWDYYFTDNGKLPKQNFDDIKGRVFAQLRMIREYEAEQIWYEEYRDSLGIQVYLQLKEIEKIPEKTTETQP